MLSGQDSPRFVYKTETPADILGRDVYSCWPLTAHVPTVGQPRFMVYTMCILRNINFFNTIHKVLT
jgi:hypothetical protein